MPASAHLPLPSFYRETRHVHLVNWLREAPPLTPKLLLYQGLLHPYNVPTELPKGDVFCCHFPSSGNDGLPRGAGTRIYALSIFTERSLKVRHRARGGEGRLVLCFAEPPGRWRIRMANRSRHKYTREGAFYQGPRGAGSEWGEPPTRRPVLASRPFSSSLLPPLCSAHQGLRGQRRFLGDLSAVWS